MEEARPAPQAVGAAVNHEHAGRPHESGSLMLLPLVVLAILSVIGGALNLPFAGLDFLAEWLHPVVEGGEQVLASGTEDLQVLLGVIASVVAIAGIAIGWLVYERKRLSAAEPAVLAHAYYYDESISRFVAGPGRAMFAAAAWFDANVIDGASTASVGSSALPEGSCASCRPAMCAATRSASGSARWPCSPGSCTGGSPDGDVVPAADGDHPHSRVRRAGRRCSSPPA